jgi:hypothetical protein
MENNKNKNGKLMLAVSVIVCVFVVSVYSSIPNPGHSAGQVGSGAFYGVAGDVWSFPGSVGIGVAEPDYRLTVSNYVKVGSGIDGEYGYLWGNPGNLWNLYKPVGSTDLVLLSYGAGGNVMSFKSATGYVGIGTTAPSYNLHVVGNIYASGNITCGGSNCGGVGGGNVSGGYWNLSGSSLYPGSTSYNVGIGTTTPGALLSLGTSVNAIKLAIYDGGAGQLYGMGIASGELTFGANIATNGTPQMVLTNTGNVGIGTTTPITKLNVNGVLSITGDYASGAGLAGSIGYTYPIARIYTGDKSGYSLRIASRTAAGAVADYVTFDDITGNVGIGTTSPGAKLEVNGVIKAQNDYPIRQQMVNRRVIFGYAGDTGLDYSNTWATVRPVVYGPFCYAVPSVQSGATRKYRVYAIYSDGLTTGNNQVWFDLDDGTDYYFNLPLTWGGVGSNNRDAYSDWYTGQPGCSHGVVKIQTTVAGSGKLWYMELQTWDFFG